MTITYPRDLPSYDLAEMTFWLDHGVRQARHARGAQSTASRIHDPVWQVRIGVEPLTEAEAFAWDAWLASLRGGLRDFLAYDLRRSVPLSVRNALPDVGGGPWTGVAAIASFPDATRIALSGLPPQLVLSAGDRLALTETIGGVARYGFFTLVAGATADATGDATVFIEPALPDGLFTVAAQVQLIEAKGLFRIRATPVPVPSSTAFGGFSFEAGQIL